MVKASKDCITDISVSNNIVLKGWASGCDSRSPCILSNYFIKTKYTANAKKINATM